MQDQPVYKSQSDPVSLASGSIPVHPPRPWAVAIAPHAAPASNPIAVTPIVLQQGQQLFTDNCAFCHGDRGKGDGPVGEVFLPRPANLTSRRVRSLTDGDIYERITNGFSTMPTFRKHLEPSARWRIVAYVRELQRRSSEP
jgi:mono/diheme cytochrome c family protein